MADFQSRIAEFEKENIKVIAASVDPTDKTSEFAEKLGLTYPVGINLDAEAISQVTGAFYDDEKKYLHPANFILRPDKTLEQSVYSSGPLGRLTAGDSLALIQYYKSQKK